MFGCFQPSPQYRELVHHPIETSMYFSGVIQKSGLFSPVDMAKCLMIYKVLAPSQLKKSTSDPPSVAAPPSCEESATPRRKRLRRRLLEAIREIRCPNGKQKNDPRNCDRRANQTFLWGHIFFKKMLVAFDMGGYTDCYPRVSFLF